MSSSGFRVEAFNEPKATPQAWVRQHTDQPLHRFKAYLFSLFPIAHWIYRYNLTWLYGDLIAGLTVGAVVVPQGMSYAKIATLAPEYGLYSSFVGVFIYCFFATSKDVSIGPVAVMSLQVGRTIQKVIEHHPEFTGQGPLIAAALTLLCGGISLGIGLLRLGFILEFIPIPAVMGFMTGSAFSIIVGQVPGLFGVAKRLDTRAATYQVVINFFKQIKYTNIDAAFGIPPLAILFFLKFISEYGAKRWPKQKPWFFYLGVLRNALVIIFTTLISYLVFKGNKENPSATLIKTVPSGLRHLGAPKITTEAVNALISELPVSVIVLLLEHIAISKSFGRINDYKIVPDQELIAIGVTNVIGIFFGAYPATGSFSRSALKAKCGVRTPLAGIYTGAVVLLALYALTEAFYWIPNASLCAVIIHAVCDLMSHPKTTYKLYLTSPVESVIFLASVLITVFVTIEAGIYFSMAASLAFLLLRIAKAKGQFLGRIEYFEVINPVIIGVPEFDSESIKSSSSEKLPSKTYEITENVSTTGQLSINSQVTRKYRWVPFDLKSYNPDLKVLPPPPGVIVFRPNESFTYPNCSRQVDYLLDEVKRVTRTGRSRHGIKLGDRPWNDHGPRHPVDTGEVDNRPLLRAIVLDFTSVPYLDATGVQNLVDIKNAIQRYAANDDIEWHFVGIISPWTKRALLVDGFGIGTDGGQKVPKHYAIDVSQKATGENEYLLQEDPFDKDPAKHRTKRKAKVDEEAEIGVVDSSEKKSFASETYVPVLSTNMPFFHSEIPDFD
ncbi:hypothetical protein DV495_000685 [Geotrichum candidum]|nr:hypothetical protein DV495_000685 [Geotrichum candidum]